MDYDAEADAWRSWREALQALKEKYPMSVDKPTLPVAIKHDGLKPRFDLLPWDALAEVNAILRYGLEEHEARNWEKGFAWLRPWNAAMRHLTAWEKGESLDPKSGRSHIAHAACEILFLLAHEVRSIGRDDRHPPIDLPDLSEK